MSTKNKNLALILIIFLIFIAFAATAWFYKNAQESDNNEPLTASQQTTDETPAHAGHDHENQKATETPAKPIAVAIDGEVYKMPVNPVLGQRGVGNPNAPVIIHEYASLTCNHCATFHTDVYDLLKNDYIDTGKVYFVFEEFPLNGPALYGSMIARCLPEERYEGFIDILFKTQEKWAFSGNFKESLRQNAKLAGMSDEEFDTCFENKELQKAISENIQAAQKHYKITSTPSFVFNHGRKVLRGVHSIEVFDAVINKLMSMEKTPATTAPANE